MFGSGISFSGLASGLDTTSIIQQLVALERLPIDSLGNQRDEAQTKLDLVGNFKDLLKALQEGADGLRTSDEFYAFSSSISLDGVATVLAGSGAEAGSHSLEVVQTATTDRFAFDAVADPDAQLGGGSLSFDLGGLNYGIAVPPGSGSLNQIAGAINDTAGDVVTASVVNTGTASSPSYQLVVASEQSGEDFRITNLSSSVAGLTVDPTEGGPNNITVGSNAIAIIDGLQIERSDNDFSDVVAGVSLDILSSGAGEVTFTVEADKEAIQEKVQGFLDAYNDVINFANQQNTYSEDAGAGGELFGDSILSTVRREIQSALFNIDPDIVINDTEGYSTLSLLGISQSSDGTLSIDSTTFDEKLTTNLDLFADLFIDSDGFDNGGAAPNTPEFYTDTTDDTGLADKLYRTIDRMFKTTQGPPDPMTGEPIVLLSTFGNRENALEATIERFQDQIDNKERLLEKFEENLVLRYAALEEAMGALNAQGAALSNALGSLPNFNSSN